MIQKDVFIKFKFSDSNAQKLYIILSTFKTDHLRI